jgi:outer membrane protein assembly factor BamB
MAGKGRVFISHSQEDATRCAPLLAALHAWGVEYVFEGARKGDELQLSERTQEAISACPIFLRICTSAIRRSYWMSLEAGAFLGLQSDDHRQGRGEARTLINLILDRDYTVEPFDRAGVLIDATKALVSVWANQLREALGLPPLADASGLGLNHMLTASGVARRRLIAGGLVAGIVAIAGGAAAVARSGVLTLPKFVESTPTATALVRSAVKPLWTVGLGHQISASLTIADGVVYAGAWDGFLYALDAKNQGKKLWSFQLEQVSQVLTSAAVAADMVYIHGNNGDDIQLPIYGLRVADGAVVWQTGKPGSAPPVSSFSQLLVNGGILYVPAVGLLPPILVGTIEAATGKIIPSDSPAGIAGSGPAIVGDTLYIGGIDGFVYALDITKKQTPIWRAQIASGATGTPVAGVDTGDTLIESTPTVVNGVLFIGSPDHNLYALNATTGKILWKYETGGVISFPSPAVANGVVYIGSDDKSLHAVDAATGKGLWKYQTGDTIRSSPAVYNGVVYIGSYDDTLYALDAVTGKVRQAYLTNQQIFASPRIVEGVLYIASYDNYVYAFQL